MSVVYSSSYRCVPQDNGPFDYRFAILTNGSIYEIWKLRVDLTTYLNPGSENLEEKRFR